MSRKGRSPHLNHHCNSHQYSFNTATPALSSPLPSVFVKSVMTLMTKRKRERVIGVQLVLGAHDGSWKLDLGILTRSSSSCLVISCKTLIFLPILLKIGWEIGLTKM